MTMSLIVSIPSTSPSSSSSSFLARVNTSGFGFGSSAPQVRFPWPRFQPLVIAPICYLQPPNPTLKCPLNCVASGPALAIICAGDRGEAVEYDEETAVDYDYAVNENSDEEEEGSSVWEGAIVYKRNALVSHIEYCTTLERLGLENVSSDLSRSRASSMGLRLTPRAAKEYKEVGTPVLVSVDVTTRKKRSPIRLDGIVRTVLALDCNRCGEAAAESVFSNFSLLLTEERIEEPDVINMGVMYGDDKSKSSSAIELETEDDGDIDLEDRLYFPVEEKEIDISKHIRDLIHLEITIDAICDDQCKGVCLECGINLNTENCNCSKEESNVDVVGIGPLGNLRKQVQQI